MELLKISGTATASLLEEIMSASEETYHPVKATEKEERLIGTCTPIMRKLYGLMVAYDQLSDQAQLDVKFAAQTGDETRRIATAKQYRETSSKYNIFKNLFWFEVSDHFQTWDGTNIGVRANWEVVTTPGDNTLEKLRDALGIS